MDKNLKEEAVLEKILENLEDSKLALLVINYFKDVKAIKSDMVKSLNLLDDIADGEVEKKDMLRTKILDNYNELPRKTLRFIDKLEKQI